MKNKMKLQNRISQIPLRPLLIFIIFLIVILIGGFIFYKNQKTKIYNDAKNELSVIAGLKAGQILQWRNERLGDAGMLSHNSLIAKAATNYFLNPGNKILKQDLLDLMRFFVEQKKYLSVVLMDYSGKQRLAFPPNDTTIGSTVLDNFRKSMQSHKSILTDLHKSTDRQIHLDLIAPLILTGTKDSLTTGLLLLRVDPNNILFPLISSWPIYSKTAETLLVRLENDSVVYLNNLRHLSNTSLSFRLPVSDTTLPATKAVLGKEGTVEGVDYRNIPVLASIIRIPESTWVMVAKIDKEEIYSPLHKQMFIIVAFIIVLIAFAASLVWVWVRNLYHRSQHEKFESELKQQALIQHFNYLSKYANDMILLLDKDLNILELNDRALESYGFTSEEALKLNLRDIRSPESRVDLSEYRKQIQQDGGLRFETIHQRKTGERFPVEVSSKYFNIEGREFYQNIIRDITERKLFEKQILDLNEDLEHRVHERTAELEEAVKELEAFSYSVSHDLRAPLRAIAGFSNILFLDYKNILDAEGIRICKVIENNAHQMGKLIDALLAFSRVGRSEIHFANINMKNMVQKAYSELSIGSDNGNPLLAQLKKNMSFHVQELPPCFGDSILIHQVWTNLISNAIKYSTKTENPQIVIGFEENPEETVYFVKDNGAGFEMEYVNKLFGVFQRLHNSTDFEGTGVGLAIVQRIIQRHGGRVWALGEVNSGASFYFSIPINHNKHE